MSVEDVKKLWKIGRKNYELVDVQECDFFMNWWMCKIVGDDIAEGVWIAQFRTFPPPWLCSLHRLTMH